MAEPESTSDNSIFEGLFQRALRPTGAFAEDLKAAGYDIKRPEIRYPRRVFQACLDVAHRHVFPSLSREEAHRKLGRLFVDGFFATIVGGVTRTIIRFLGLDRFMARLPKLATMTTTGMEVETKKVSPVEYQVVYRGRDLSPDFIAGSMEGSDPKTSVFKLRVEVVSRSPDGFELRAHAQPA